MNPTPRTAEPARVPRRPPRHADRARPRAAQRRPGRCRRSGRDLGSLGELLLSRRGEASGVALRPRPRRGLRRGEPEDRQLDFLALLAHRFGPDRAAVDAAIEADGRERARRDRDAARRRRAATAGADPRLTCRRAARPRWCGCARRCLGTWATSRKLRRLDADFAHLFALVQPRISALRQIDWTTPANILEKIIRYEAVRAIDNWDDLRSGSADRPALLRLRPPAAGGRALTSSKSR